MLLRAVFWLVVLTLFLPPEYRPLPFVEFKLPERLGDNSQVRREGWVPENNYCAQQKDVCLKVSETLDGITSMGLIALGHVKSAIVGKHAAVIERKPRDTPLIGRLIED